MLKGSMKLTSKHWKLIMTEANAKLRFAVGRVEFRRSRRVH